MNCRSALVAACAATLAIAPAASAAGKQDGPDDPQAKKFVAAVSASKILEHQRDLQAIADANGGTREVESSGYTASVQYVKKELQAAGYKVTVDQFDFPKWRETQPAEFKQVSPTAKTYRYGTHEQDGSAAVDFITMAYSPTKSTGTLKVVPTNDIAIPTEPGASTSGCEASDYPAETKGNIALVQRGTCAFVDKAAMAQQVGAAGVVIFNDGASATRQNPVAIDDSVDLTIPAVVSSFSVGKELYDAYKAGQNPTASLSTFGELQSRFFPQVIAETKSGDPDNVVVVGAHLDSVPAGPGINDDGSGTATLLAEAEELAKPGHKLQQKIRFGWWGAEEEGLVGSRYYASHLSQSEVDKIDVMLDYDMLSSPNYARLVYDGDGSEEGNPAGPAGSGKVESVFNDWFEARGQHSQPIPFDGRSDYVGFTDRGIPSGGIFAGAEGVKTEQEVQWYGGVAGSWYDPCYHQACDNFQTVSTGVPPLEAEGLAWETENPTDAQKAAAAEAMRGGAVKSLKELAAAANYAVWYFSSTKDPFGTATKGHKKPKHKIKGRGHSER